MTIEKKKKKKVNGKEMTGKEKNVPVSSTPWEFQPFG